MQGMTKKQIAVRHFFDLIEKKKQLDFNTLEGRHAFISLSVQIHATKGDVPKRFWKYANS